MWQRRHLLAKALLNNASFNLNICSGKFGKAQESNQCQNKWWKLKTKLRNYDTRAVTKETSTLTFDGYLLRNKWNQWKINCGRYKLLRNTNVGFMRCHEAIPDLPSSPWEPKRDFKTSCDVILWVNKLPRMSWIFQLLNTSPSISEIFSLAIQKQKVICGTPLNWQYLFSK